MVPMMMSPVVVGLFAYGLQRVRVREVVVT